MLIFLHALILFRVAMTRIFVRGFDTHRVPGVPRQVAERGTPSPSLESALVPTPGCGDIARPANRLPGPWCAARARETYSNSLCRNNSPAIAQFFRAHK